MLTLMSKGGPLMWLILFNALLALGVFLEKLFSFHRAQIKTGVVNHDRSHDEIREAMVNVAHSEVAHLERRLVVLATIAQVMPLIGFLGTVMGMIQMFKVIQEAQLPSPGQLAAYNYLVTRVQQLVLDMEKAANEIHTLLVRRQESKLNEPPAR